nr:tripartite tricarboxylate transporter permease [uncultured Agathobaculum sp.]
MLESLISVIGVVLQPTNLLIMLLGTFVGIFVGAMPGLSSIMGLSLMLPLTLRFDGSTGILMLLGVFCGAIYGGSITAILVKTPGTANSAATVLDGYPLTQRGEAARALGISTFASTFGGLFSAIMLLWTAPLLSKVALSFTSPEYFSLAIFGLSMVTSLSSKDVTKGLISAVIGLMLATVGMDALTGAKRFTFGSTYFRRRHPVHARQRQPAASGQRRFDFCQRHHGRRSARCRRAAASRGDFRRNHQHPHHQAA